MIHIYDGFLPDNIFRSVYSEVMGLKFYNDKTHPHSIEEKKNTEGDDSEFSLKYPGTRTDELGGSTNASPLIDSIIVSYLDSLGSSFTNRRYRVTNYAHLRLECDDSKDFIHTDQCSFAYLLYLSATNLESGTKMYSSVDEDRDNENCFVKFVQNRLVIYDALTPHMSWGNHGTDISNGRLTINGFCDYI